MTTTSTGPHATAVDIGNVSPAEQELLELVNRARRDPVTEGTRYGLNLTGIPATPPLAPNALLGKAGLDHNTDMAKNKFFAHVSPTTGLDPLQQVKAAGYDPIANGQNISASGVGPIDPKSHHAKWMIDQGINPPVHRYNILSYDPTGQGLGVFREFGSSYLNDQVKLNGAQFDQYALHNFGTARANRPFVTGVAFDDTNNTSDYDAGEGLGNVKVTLYHSDGTSIATTTRAAGGYAFEVKDAGTYMVEFAGGPFLSPTKVTVKVASSNVKVDAVVGKGAIAR
jgi:uncharacterized protein YkwD